jgi:phospholipid/cholesterol/gamma-HCH transport system substrate-binding protein
MPRTRSLAWSELKIGIVAILALVLLVVLVLAVGGEGGYFWQRYPLKARFSDVQGLKAGAVVRLAGKEIGTVRTVEFSGAEVEVGFELLEDVRPIVTSNTTAAIGSLSLLGEPIIDLRTAPGGTPLADHAYVKTTPPPASFAQLADTASTSLTQMDQLLTDIRTGKGTLGRIVTDDGLYTEMEALMASAARVANALDAGHGTLGSLIKDPSAYAALKSALENLQTTTARINSGQGALGRLLNDEAMGRSLASTTANLESMTGRLTKGEGTIGKLMTDQQLYDRLNSMTARVDEVASGLAAGRGTAGQLLKDQQLYENMNQAVIDLRNLLADIRKDPRKYLRVNVSIF